MIIVTTLIQGVFTAFGVEYVRSQAELHPTRSLIRSTLRLSAFVLWLFLATVLQVWAWAILYVSLGALDRIDTAVYFSTVTFTTLGYGDITLDDEWRVLSSFQAANGLLMFGWSTALIFAGVQWIYEHRVSPKARWFTHHEPH